MKTPLIRPKPTRWFAAACGLALAGLLSACGSSSNYDEPVPVVVDDTKVPASATVSVSAYASYAGSLAKSETKTPLDVNAVVPPTSETDIPVAI
jgi:hypothetical protein